MDFLHAYLEARVVASPTVDRVLTDRENGIDHAAQELRFTAAGLKYDESFDTHNKVSKLLSGIWRTAMERAVAAMREDLASLSADRAHETRGGE